MPVWVKGYFRSNGTYVKGHWRSSPDDSFYNNWSTVGNVNPYTGEAGTVKSPSVGTTNYTSTFVVKDITPPTLATTAPGNKPSEVAVSSNILLTFSESIQRGAGSIVLKSGDDAVIATYDAATSSNLSITGKTLTINPTGNLAYSSNYRVELADGSIKDLSGNGFAKTNSYSFSTESRPVMQGSQKNDTLKGGYGVFIDGSGGIDTVGYSEKLVQITRNTNGSWTVGSDNLSNIERLQFPDKNIAIDITDNTLETLQLIGVIAPSLQNDLSVRGVVLGLFDQGYSMEQLCQLALDLGLVPANNTALANTVYQNVLSSTASQDMTNALLGYIEQHGDASFLAAVAGMSINVDLVGLQQQGMEYL